MNTILTSEIIVDYEGETWKYIDGYDHKYLISNYGRVKSLKGKKERLLRQYENNAGYLRVGLTSHGKTKYYFVHRLVAIAFIKNDDPKEKQTVDHIDGDKHNNCDTNLQWLSLADNIRLYYKKRIA